MKTFVKLILMSMMAYSLPAMSGKLKHEFEVPAFGGNPLNGSYYLGIAGAINDYDDPDRTEYVAPTELERLADSLQSQLISQLLYDVRQGETGYLETDLFKIEAVQNDAGGIVVNIFDTQTGEITSIDVGGFQ